MVIDQNKAHVANQVAITFADYMHLTEDERKAFKYNQDTGKFVLNAGARDSDGSAQAYY
jgi:hypothetical protein